MTLSDARAIAPALLTRPAAPARDRRALRRLARWAGRYGPARNVEGRDGLWVDITGVAHLFLPSRATRTGAEAEVDAGAAGTRAGRWGQEAEKALLGDLARRLSDFGLTARLAIADTRAGAHALARFGRTGPTGCLIAAPGATARALAGLPVEALDLDTDAAVLLRRLGLKRIGQLYDLPRATLAHRFRAPPRARADNASVRRPATGAGSDALAGAVLQALDAALGRTPAPAIPLVEPPDFTVRHLPTEPLVTSEGIEAAVSELLDALSARLAAAGCGARRIGVLLTRTDGTHAAFQAGLSTASHDGAHLCFLLLPKLAGFDGGFGVDGIVLEAYGVERIDPHQTVLATGTAIGPDDDADHHARAATSVLIDRIANRLGSDAVLRLVPRASHVPERAESRRPALEGALPARRIEPCAAPVRYRPRPPLLLAPPERITVLAEIPEGPPARFTWRRLTCRIAKAEGPERIAPEWWRRADTANAARAQRPRDYYTVEDVHGARYWLFREGLYGEAEAEVDAPPTWYLHGLGP